jgi:hypothetical protein
VIFDEDNAKVFGEYIGKRYAGLPKILGGDSNRYIPNPLTPRAHTANHVS